MQMSIASANAPSQPVLRRLARLCARLVLGTLALAACWALPTSSAAQDLFRDLLIFRPQSQIDQVLSGISRGISRIPLSSTPGGFVFRFDAELGLPQPVTESLGPQFLERAPTLGRRAFSLGVSATSIDFDRLEGDDVSDLFDATVVERPGGALTITRTQDVRLDLEQKLSAVSLFFGFAERFDVGLVIPVVFNRLRAISTISGSRQTPAGSEGPLPTVVTSSRLEEKGLGDVLLRAKYYFGDQRLPFDFALALDMKFPTGDEEKLLGNGDFELRPFAIASRAFGIFTPHVNLGGLINTRRSGRNGYIYGVGTDVRLHPRLTVLVEHLGQIDDEDVLADVAFGVKWNPWRRLVLRGSVRFSINDDGLRDPLIPTLGIEANF